MWKGTGGILNHTSISTTTQTIKSKEYSVILTMKFKGQMYILPLPTNHKSIIIIGTDMIKAKMSRNRDIPARGISEFSTLLPLSTLFPFVLCKYIMILITKHGC